MENEVQEIPMARLDQLADRLVLAIELLEQAIPRISASAASVGPIVATVESTREAELAARLSDAEKTIAAMKASAGAHDGRRTQPATLLAKQEGSSLAESTALDAALVSLSLEQRIAVKAQLLRAGLI